jgi:hypothetical protein
MPLANDTREVAGVVEMFDEGHLTGVEDLCITAQTVEVTVLTCENNRATGSTDRIRYKRIAEDSTFAPDPIHIRGFDQLIAVDARSLLSVIVRDNDENIGSGNLDLRL